MVSKIKDWLILLRLLFVQTSSTKIEEMATNFHLEGSVRKNRTTCSDVMKRSNKQNISQFWFLKLTKQIKSKFSFCLTLRLKPFLLS